MRFEIQILLATLILWVSGQSLWSANTETQEQLNAVSDISYDRDIRPILSDRCFHCHGPVKHDQKAELRLDQTGGSDGAYRSGTCTGNPRPTGIKASKIES
ncbi:MAG: hypothetical protein QNL65_03710 [Opitutales bacterium]|jgi:hypothetical protein|nr:hypothetical protein [Opitutae bacterium]MBT6958803.1 hypothetical protein [Opitutae bacterium]MBT7405536.1 hypothetical protein [Opitutae bacterium]|tara:strand:- start:8510 stop:8812 length:303 start_codon:yes stop_codon:yes gene_type:complete